MIAADTLNKTYGSPRTHGSLVMCPEKETLPLRNREFSFYGWNIYYFDKKFCAPQRIRQASALFMLADKKTDGKSPPGPYRQEWVWGNTSTWETSIDQRSHPHGFNVLFFDGHAEGMQDHRQAAIAGTDYPWQE